MKSNSGDEERRKILRQHEGPAFDADLTPLEAARLHRARERQEEIEGQEPLWRDMKVTWDELADGLGVWKQWRRVDSENFGVMQEADDHAEYYLKDKLGVPDREELRDHGKSWIDFVDDAIGEDARMEVETLIRWDLERHYAPKNYVKDSRALDRGVELVNECSELGGQAAIYEDGEPPSGKGIEILSEFNDELGEGLVFRVYPPFMIAWAEAYFYIGGYHYNGEKINHLTSDEIPRTMNRTMNRIADAVGERLRFDIGDWSSSRELDRQLDQVVEDAIKVKRLERKKSRAKRRKKNAEASQIKHVCLSCQKVYAGDPNAPVTSHGYCATCGQAELDRLKKPNDMGPGTETDDERLRRLWRQAENGDMVAIERLVTACRRGGMHRSMSEKLEAFLSDLAQALDRDAQNESEAVSRDWIERAASRVDLWWRQVRETLGLD